MTTELESQGFHSRMRTLKAGSERDSILPRAACTDASSDAPPPASCATSAATSGSRSRGSVSTATRRCFAAASLSAHETDHNESESLILRPFSCASTTRAHSCRWQTQRCIRHGSKRACIE